MRKHILPILLAGLILAAVALPSLAQAREAIQPIPTYKVCHACDEAFPAASPPAALPTPPSPALPLGAQPGTPTVRLLYFYAVDCPHCQVVKEEVLIPLSAQYGAQLDVRMLEIGTPVNYELLIRAEETFAVPAEERAIPTLVIGDQVLIGEDTIREQLPPLIERGLAQGGIDWPDIPGLDVSKLAETASEPGSGDPGACEKDESVCEAAAPVWAAYFYQVGCQECSRVEIDLEYTQSRYPQLVLEKLNIYDNAGLAQWLAERAGRGKDLHAPAIFIGDEALIGEGEITPQNLERVIEKYTSTGVEKVWATFDTTEVQQGLVERFSRLGPLTVVFAGLIDGLNPCAFATLVFFVSYLTLSGRKGREVLTVGAAFTLGVFLAYLVIGLGFYKVLDLVGNWLTMLGRWVYGLTSLLCAALAVFSFLDFLKARQGQIGDMSLNLPHSLRRRINAVIRKGREMRAYVAGAFTTGVIISFLELACTGQIYLPTIIFVTSIPELRVRAIGYLVIYNLLFTLPLVVVFVMAYYGTTSKDLSRFLERRAATVKLGMMVLFASLAVWLGTSLV